MNALIELNATFFRVYKPKSVAIYLKAYDVDQRLVRDRDMPQQLGDRNPGDGAVERHVEGEHRGQATERGMEDSNEGEESTRLE